MKVLIETITSRKGYKFFENEDELNKYLSQNCDKIAMALGLTVNSAKVLVIELIREGYLLKSTDNYGRRILNLSGKPYLTISCVDLSNIDKKIIAQEAANYQRDAEYYKKQYEFEKARADRLAEEYSKLQLKNN